MTAQVAAPSETAAVAAIAAMLHQSTPRPVQQDTERLYDPKLPEALRGVEGQSDRLRPARPALG
jgi:hypothetical protein